MIVDLGCLCMPSSDLSSVHGELASVRAELLTFFTHVLLGDSLAAEYLILHLISNVYVSHFEWLCCMSEVWLYVASSPHLIYGTNLSIYIVYFGKSYATYLLDVLWSFSTVTCFLRNQSYPQSFRLNILKCVLILDTADGMFFLWANSHWISAAVLTALHTLSISTRSSNSSCLL